jgi:parvulin-like peptidyl-prolyl isomerase
MMTKMREMTKALIIILSAAFIGMMVVEWGANYAGFRKVQDYVAIIDGEKIKIDRYQQAYQQNIENLRKQGVNEAIINSKAHEMTWDQFLLEKVLAKVRDQYEINITPDEIAFYTMNIPPDILRQNPQLLTNGQFDIEKYRSILKSNRNLFAQIYEYYKQQLPLLKVDEVLYDAVQASIPEGVDSYLESYYTADIEYLYIPRLAFRKRPSQISDDAAKKYYEQHRDEFKIEEQRNLEYVAISVPVTKEDSIRVEKQVREIYDLLQKGEDFLELADIYSDEYYTSGKRGDLGEVDLNVYVSTVPELKTAKIGEIIGPKKIGSSFKIYKLVDRKITKDVTGKKLTKVHLYSITITYKPSSETIELFRQKAEEFKELAEDKGFAEAAKELGLEVKETGPFQKDRFIPGIGMHKAIGLFAFDNDEGDISKVFVKSNPLNKNIYYIVRVKEIIPESIQPFDDVINVCKARVEYENREIAMKAHAKYIDGLIRKYGELVKAAEMDTAKIAKFDKVMNHHPVNPLKDIGLDYAFSYYAYYLAPINQIKGPVRGQRGLFFIKVVKRDSLNMDEAIKNSDSRIALILNNRRTSFIQKWIENEKKKLEVEDYRYLFYSEL